MPELRGSTLLYPIKGGAGRAALRAVPRARPHGPPGTPEDTQTPTPQARRDRTRAEPGSATARPPGAPPGAATRRGRRSGTDFVVLVYAVAGVPTADAEHRGDGVPRLPVLDDVIAENLDVLKT